MILSEDWIQVTYKKGSTGPAENSLRKDSSTDQAQGIAVREFIGSRCCMKRKECDGTVTGVS
jgi:hypothetical protein